MPEMSRALDGARRHTQEMHGRRYIAVIEVTLLLIGIMAGSAGGTTTLPVLWTAGGLDAGTMGAGQAGRMTSDAAGNVAVVSGPDGGA